MKAIKMTLVILFMLIGAMAFGQGVAGAEVEDINLDPRVASMVCSAAAIIAEDEVLAGWFATIVSDPESIEYFLELFAKGFKDGSVTNDDIVDVVEACIVIRDDIEKLDAVERDLDVEVIPFAEW